MVQAKNEMIEKVKNDFFQDFEFFPKSIELTEGVAFCSTEDGINYAASLKKTGGVRRRKKISTWHKV